MSSVKDLVELGCLTSVPCKYIYKNAEFDALMATEPETIPTVDFSLLRSCNPDQRSKVVTELGNACREWGFFMVINHGVRETLRDEMIRETKSFFDLTWEEKRQYAGKNLFDPICCGTSFNTNVDKSLLWRDFLKIRVNPHFNAPKKPYGFSKVLEEYSKKTREMASELLKAIFESLGLEESGVECEDSNQLLVANMYPPCPQPELSMGLPPHSDYGLLTILIQNELPGLQIMHNGKWVPINPLSNSFLVNIGDHMEILTNGKYKSVVHRAMVNNKATRISIGTAHGPPLDAVVSPAPELVEDRMGKAYLGMKYRDYIELKQSKSLSGKSTLDHLRLSSS